MPLRGSPSAVLSAGAARRWPVPRAPRRPASNREPCSGQSQLRSASFQRTIAAEVGAHGRRPGARRRSCARRRGRAQVVAAGRAVALADGGPTPGRSSGRSQPAAISTPDLGVDPGAVDEPAQLVRAPGLEDLGPLHVAAEDPAGQGQRPRPRRWSCPTSSSRRRPGGRRTPAAAGRRTAARGAARSPGPTRRASPRPRGSARPSTPAARRAGPPRTPPRPVVWPLPPTSSRLPSGSGASRSDRLGLVRREVHAVHGRLGRPEGQAVGPRRLDPREEAAPVEDRHVGREHDRVRAGACRTSVTTRDRAAAR